MTDPQKADEIVAQAIEDKPDYDVFSQADDNSISHKGIWEWVWNIGDYLDEGIEESGYWIPRPFISAPIWELEGIVLEWVQQSELFPKWSLTLTSTILAKMDDLGKEMEQIGLGSVWWIKQLKVGMWARALLQVLEANDG